MAGLSARADLFPEARHEEQAPSRMERSAKLKMSVGTDPIPMLMKSLTLPSRNSLTIRSPHPPPAMQERPAMTAHE
jgi:hypothetical protein